MGKSIIKRLSDAKKGAEETNNKETKPTAK